MEIIAIDYAAGIVTYKVTLSTGEDLVMPVYEDWDIIPTLKLGKQ